MSSPYPFSLYPFSRSIRTNLDQSKNVLTITGQLITEVFNRGDMAESDDPPNDIDTLNPQTLEISYLLRYQLEELSDQTFDYLLNEKKRTQEEILRAAQIIREAMWDCWDETVSYCDDNGSDPYNYFTGAQAEQIGTKSYRSWIIYSDPFAIFDVMPDEWIAQKQWKLKEPITLAEIYSVLTLWLIDESAAYLNNDNPYKATTWLLRAVQSQFYAKESDDESLATAKKSLARLGGIGKKKTYQPLRDLVVELMKLKNYPSRRNAAYSLKPEVLKKAKELNIGFSEQQAHITISIWLKELGLPANI